MPIQAIVRLNTIRCIAERDSPRSSGSEPYIWGFLTGIGSNPLSLDSTPDFPILAESRKVLKNSMTAGQSAPMDFPGNLFVQNFETGQKDCQLIFIVALLEADELSTSAMQDGYQAFVDALRAEIPRIVALDGLSEADRKEAMKPIIKAVETKVFAGVESGLSTTEKLSIAAGFTDKDDFVASDFRHFENIEMRTTAEAFTLRLSGTPVKLLISNGSFGSHSFSFPREFEVDGELTVTGVEVDRCTSHVEGVKEAQTALAQLRSQLAKLTERLETVPRDQQEVIRARIDTLISEELPAARRRLNLAQMALRRCRVFGGGVEPPVEGPIVDPVG